jgi:excisionase family DNA binding protein
MNEARMLTMDEAAERLRLSRRQVERLITSGELAARRIGRSVRITESNLTAFVNDPQAIPPLNPAPKRHAVEGETSSAGAASSIAEQR